MIRYIAKKSCRFKPKLSSNCNTIRVSFKYHVITTCFLQHICTEFYVQRVSKKLSKCRFLRKFWFGGQDALRSSTAHSLRSLPTCRCHFEFRTWDWELIVVGRFQILDWKLAHAQLIVTVPFNVSFVYFFVYRYCIFLLRFSNYLES